MHWVLVVSAVSIGTGVALCRLGCDRALTTVSEIGDPKRVVVDYADEEDVDQIVLGAHGREESGRSVFGSVAEIVARRATVTVTLVR